MEEKLHCANHPTVETRLRCSKCGKPICTKCALATPVGYRCRACVNAQQRAFYSGFKSSYYVVAALVALPLSLVAGSVVPRLGWYAILLGPVAGGGIAEAVRWSVRRKRGEYTWLVVCGCIVVGALPVLTLSLLSVLGVLGGTTSALAPLAGGVLRLLWLAVYLSTAVGAAYARLRPTKRV